MIEAFANENRLKTKMDECGELIILGRQGQLYEYNNAELGVMFMPGSWTPKTWGNFKRAGLAIGMILRQNGDSEGCLSFDPKDREQVELAIKAAGVRPKRRVSPEQRALMAERLALARQNRSEPQEEGVLSV